MSFDADAMDAFIEHRRQAAAAETAREATLREITEEATRMMDKNNTAQPVTGIDAEIAELLHAKLEAEAVPAPSAPKMRLIFIDGAWHPKESPRERGRDCPTSAATQSPVRRAAPANRGVPARRHAGEVADDALQQLRGHLQRAAVR
jgi:hypothetical protein